MANRGIKRVDRAHKKKLGFKTVYRPSSTLSTDKIAKLLIENYKRK